MPYYCTVPRCTSMAGKVKNVSFHQFPRDEELATLWNKILKRGKPYTKYSKVCSLHFTPDDYTITNAGKYKGQWRTLRKDAIPSRNLPLDSPVPYQRRDYPSLSPSSTVDPRLHQQMAQAIYVQTMLAMQAAGVTDVGAGLFNADQRLPSPNTEECSRSPDSSPADQFDARLEHMDQLLHQRNDLHTDNHIDSSHTDNTEAQHTEHNDTQIHKLSVVSKCNTGFLNENKVVTYKCNDCSKCFKDPDVFLLHKRMHTKSPLRSNEKENLNGNNSLESNTQETLKANPILANLLKSGVPQGSIFGQRDLEVTKAFDTNVVSIESQIMTALAANMENYLRNLSTIMSRGLIDNESIQDEENVDSLPEAEESKENNVGENGPNFDDVDEKTNNCDKNKDLDDSQDSLGLVIDEDKC